MSCPCSSLFSVKKAYADHNFMFHSKNTKNMRMSNNEYAWMLQYLITWNTSRMSRRAANALTNLRREDCAQPFEICLNYRQLSSTTAVNRDMSFDRNFCLPARSWISLISYIDDRSLRVSISTLFILQTTGAPSSRRCPSQDRRGGLCSVFQGWLGRRRCRCRCGGVCGRRSGVEDRVRRTLLSLRRKKCHLRVGLSGQCQCPCAQ